MKQPVQAQIEQPTRKQRLKVIRLFMNIYHNNRKRQSILRSMHVSFRYCVLIWKDETRRSAR
jgi:hypothetical protein